MIKRIYKYPTGAIIPSNAEYLGTIKNGRMGVNPTTDRHTEEDVRLFNLEVEYVWHYFLVEVDE